ncbi:MAG: UDP-N-acetylenolpyruvoylglucosamine reductase [Candidatus Solibacter sp.]|nr:UDP-N-acetylenolpyruvoylglucosamine reductase [Candidatus Solibacter sp.]
MSSTDEAPVRLAEIPDLQLTRNEPLSRHTRFEIGGPASIYAEARTEAAFVEAMKAVNRSHVRHVVAGSGTNLVVADAGFPGVVLTFTGDAITAEGNRVTVQAGASLQSLVDSAIAHGLKGLDSMTGIPGQAGAAIYGNAGAYGNSISDFVREVRFFDGDAIRTFDNAACEFRYRSSVFKRHKDWVILSAALEFQSGDPTALAERAAQIHAVRNAKYPPGMRCAGSIFKNLILAELPARVRAMVPPEIVKGGKVPSAWFLDVTGVKGMKSGGIHVADYHANLIFNAGGGTARELRQVINELKRRVRDRFGIGLEEEVQYVGFDERLPALDTLASTPRIIDELISCMPPDDLNWQPAPGRWCIAEVLMHLAHCEEVCFVRRTRDMLDQSDPPLAPYNVDEFTAADWGFNGDGLAALARLHDLRRTILDMLETQPATSGSRAGAHPDLGRITLAELLNEWAFHDLGHIRQIAEIVRVRRFYPDMGPFRPLYTVNP